MRESPSRPLVSAAILTASVFVIGVLTTLLIEEWVTDRAVDDERSTFERQADNALDGMESVVDTYIDDFDDAVAFTGALNPPDPAQFQRFVAANNATDPYQSDLVLYIERVEPGELDAVIDRETTLRGQPFVPLSLRQGETLYLVMRSATPGAGVDLPPGDVAMVEPFRDVLEATAETRELRLIDFADAYEAITGPDGLADRFGVAPDVLMTILDRIGLTADGVASGREFGVVAPVDDDRGRIVGYIMGDAVASESFERFASRYVAVSVEVRDPDGRHAVVAGRTGGNLIDSAPLVESRIVTADGLEFELTAYLPATAVGSSRLAEVLVATGLAATILMALLVHRWRRWDLESDEMAEQLEHTERRAHTDPLTGLLNREGITDALATLLAGREPDGGLVVALFVDVDRLKVVNDSLGHGVGDAVLTRLAERFEVVAGERAQVGRFGGDEFVLVAGQLRDLGAAIVIAQDVLRCLALPLRAGDVELRMDASVGVSFARSTEEVAASDLIRDADSAMYESKRDGGNRYSVFDDRLRIEAIDRLLVEQSLGQAVQLQEIETWFQPIVDVDVSDVVSMEALVRWRSDGGEVVLPHRFLPVAVETGLIVPIGDWVLTEACTMAAEVDAGAIDMAVNLSERELADPRCLDRIRDAIDGAGLDPTRLTVEISEDLMIDRLARSVDMLRTIHDWGVRLSIDDFGTGMSSLSYVKRLDMIAELKIDESFVTDIASSHADRAIVAAILAMTDSLGMVVVAEGVETQGQVNCLRDLGVRRMQGFYFGRPQPRDMALEMSRSPRRFNESI